MFGSNTKVGREYFSDRSKSGSPDLSLMVTTMFTTLQGEGPFSGRPAIFVRLAKCNLNCSFCDTYFDDGMWFSHDRLEHELVAKGVEKYGNERAVKRYLGVVFTGGEPSLQTSLPLLIARLVDKFAFVQIESNGILPFPTLPDETMLVISPKVVEVDGKMLDHYTTPAKNNLQRADCLKFVLSADAASPYHTVPKWAFDWQFNTRNPIYVSPMNIYAKPPQVSSLASMHQRAQEERISFWTPGLLDLERVRANHEYAAEYALKNGIWLTLQTHLFANLP